MPHAATGLNLVAGPARPLNDHAGILPDLIEWAGEYAGAGLDAGQLAAIFAHSRHLQGLARAHPQIITPILTGSAAEVVHDAMAAIDASAGEIDDEARMMAAIRRLRQQSALAVALSDMAGTASVETQMAWLSEAAVCALKATVKFLFRQANRRGQISDERVITSPGMKGCGWTVLALGKLGAGELNYSSDIDLILLHDPMDNPLLKPDQSQTFYVGMARDLVRLLSAATADGIGWRVDLRLRPDPGATAVSIQREAAIGYYESIARTWERAAFIRARPVAGDIAMGRHFLADIQPFIWRRNLDYTVMGDMKVMLRRPVAAPGWEGFNLKTGPNGIRSIEFLTHVLQLVGGGRAASLRGGSTLPALDALADESWISAEQKDRLSALYLELRRAEHRLQMMADAQTHALPRSMEAIAEAARFMGHAEETAFLAALRDTLAEVGANNRHRLFADEDDGHDEADAPPLEDAERLSAWLAPRGFSRPDDIAAILSGWTAGRIAATRGERARALLGRLIPPMLTHLAKAADPDAAFAAFAGFVEGLPASVQIFSLLDHNRDLTRLLGDILVLSPRLGATLRRHPMLFDLVLFGDFFAPLSDADSFEADLRDTIEEEPVEAALEIITRMTRERRFRAEVQRLSGVSDRAALGRALADSAEAVIRVIADLARADMDRRHGAIEGGFVVIAMGRLGLCDLTATSDLDLVFAWDAPAEAQSAGRANGGGVLGATAYFTRLAQTLASWLGGATGEGDLYSIDTRLRPDGEKGAFAPRLDRIEEYYREEAWLWEKLALAKARVVTPASALAERTTGLIRNVVTSPLPATDLATALHEMRRRMRASYGDAPDWQLRKQPGGIGEIDLLVQGLRLVHADLFDGNAETTPAIIDRLVAAARLTAQDAEQLAAADRLFTDLHHALRLVVGSSTQHPDTLAPAARQFVLEACDCPDLVTLAGQLGAARADVESMFDRLMQPPRI